MEKIIVTLWITFGLYIMVLLAIMAEFQQKLNILNAFREECKGIVHSLLG